VPGIAAMLNEEHIAGKSGLRDFLAMMMKTGTAAAISLKKGRLSCCFLWLHFAKIDTVIAAESMLRVTNTFSRHSLRETVWRITSSAGVGQGK